MSAGSEPGSDKALLQRIRLHGAIEAALDAVVNVFMLSQGNELVMEKLRAAYGALRAAEDCLHTEKHKVIQRGDECDGG